MFVNSGSEANDLAWRMARAVTGDRGGIATDYAYHGIIRGDQRAVARGLGHAARARTTSAPGDRPTRCAGPTTALADLDAAIGELEAAGHGASAAILDGVLTSDGIIDLDPSLAAALVDRTHAAGGAVDRRRGPGRLRPDRRRRCGRTGGSGSRPTS